MSKNPQQNAVVKIDLSDPYTQQAIVAVGKAVLANTVTNPPHQVRMDNSQQQQQEQQYQYQYQQTNKDTHPRQQYFVYKYKYGDPESEKQYELAIGCGTTWCCFFLGFCCFPFWFIGAVMGSKLQRGSPVERSGFIANIVACSLFLIFGLIFVINRLR